MKEYILAALPWAVIVLFLAVLIIKRNISKNKEKKSEDYSAEGMSIGMMIKKENLGRKIVDKKREDFVYSTFGDYSFLDGHHLFL